MDPETKVPLDPKAQEVEMSNLESGQAAQPLKVPTVEIPGPVEGSAEWEQSRDGEGASHSPTSRTTDGTQGTLNKAFARTQPLGAAPEGIVQRRHSGQSLGSMLLQDFHSRASIYATFSPVRLALMAIAGAILLALLHGLNPYAFKVVEDLGNPERSKDKIEQRFRDLQAQDGTVELNEASVAVVGGFSGKDDPAVLALWRKIPKTDGNSLIEPVVAIIVEEIQGLWTESEFNTYCEELQKTAVKGMWVKTAKDIKCKFKPKDPAVADPELKKAMLGTAKFTQRSNWRGAITVSMFVAVICLVIQGLPGEVLLLGSAAFLSLIGVVSSESVYAGLSNSGILGLAILFPLADAVSETGILEKSMGKVLGSPKSLNVALLRMMLPVAVLSAFLSNTAAVALMIPVLSSWARRLDVHPGKLMMPLSFASQLGGSMTKIGSSHCMIAADVTKEKYSADGHGMGMFDLTTVGTPLMIGTCLVIMVLANTPFLASSADGAGGDEGDQTKDIVQEEELYRVRVVVEELLAGQSLADTGLARMKGVSRVDVVRGASDRLKEGDVLEFFCGAPTLKALRIQAGVLLEKNQELIALGAHRRARHLYEVAVEPDSIFITTHILKEPHTLRQEFGAVFVAGPKTLVTNEVPPVQAGSVLLFEASEDWVNVRSKDKWSAAFSLIVEVPGSSPPRVGGPVDDIRSAAVCLGMFTLILACAQPWVKVNLHIAGTVLLMFFLVIRAISVERMFRAMKLDILLIIAGAMAMGDALQTTGVVGFAASRMTTLASGQNNVSIMIYCVAVFLSMFINNSATVAILGPICSSIVELDSSISMKVLTFVLTFAAGSCFTTPLGYQTNLMVMPAGKYSFGDFGKFGGLVQLCHMGLCLLLVPLFAAQ